MRRISDTLLILSCVFKVLEDSSEGVYRFLKAGDVSYEAVEPLLAVCLIVVFAAVRMKSRMVCNQIT